MSTQAISSLLDRFIPLRNASHSDVLRYSIEIPMRYCECSAVLADGRTASLLNPRACVGWSCRGRDRFYLFRSGDGLVELRSHAEQDSANRDLPVLPERFSVRQLDRTQTIPMPQGCKDRRTFTGVDGSLFVLDADGVVPAYMPPDRIPDSDYRQGFRATAG